MRWERGSRPPDFKYYGSREKPSVIVIPIKQGNKMSILPFQDLQALQSLTESSVQFDDKGVSLKMASKSAKQKLFT